MSGNMNDEYADDSDSSDEDYVPSGAAGDIPSEVESDGDDEDPLSENEDEGNLSKRRTKNTKGSKTKTKSKSKAQSKTDTLSCDNDTEQKKQEQTTEEKKKRADDLWAMFKKDTNFVNKKEANKSTAASTTNPTTAVEKKIPDTPAVEVKKPDTVKITQIFEFAGEEVKIEKEVKADSAEARLAQTTASAAPAPGPPKRKAGLGGIGSVLSQIGKKQKLSTLEKTKLDWNRFKQDNKVEEELESYKKGKDGYLDKKDFLERADLRQFEIERDIRGIERSKRMSNVPQV